MSPAACARMASQRAIWPQTACCVRTAPACAHQLPMRVQAGGFKVSALAIENVLAAHPAVREVAVVGLPHPQLGDEITAVVSCRPSQQVGAEPLAHAMRAGSHAHHAREGCVMRCLGGCSAGWVEVQCPAWGTTARRACAHGSPMPMLRR